MKKRRSVKKLLTISNSKQRPAVSMVCVESQKNPITPVNSQEKIKKVKRVNPLNDKGKDVADQRLIDFH